MKIRNFKSTDAGKVSALSNDNLAAFQYEVNSDFLSRMDANERYQMFVLSDGSEVLGFAGLNFEQLPLAELGPICVASTRRGSGLGRLLVDYVFEFADNIGVKKIIIKVKTSNITGQEFFGKLGFETVGETVCKGEPAILMQDDVE